MREQQDREQVRRVELAILGFDVVAWHGMANYY
jgi:hypothetical protein